MGHIPKGAKWWIADLIEEITVQGERRNVVHRNTVLIRANSADEAHRKALGLGREGNTTYENPARQKVRIRFRGIAHLDVIHDKLEHGAELTFERKTGVSLKQIKRWVKAKHQLEAFLPPACELRRSRPRPDYASREVLEEVNRRFGPYPELERLFAKNP